MKEESLNSPFNKGCGVLVPLNSSDILVDNGLMSLLGRFLDTERRNSRLRARNVKRRAYVDLRQTIVTLSPDVVNQSSTPCSPFITSAIPNPVEAQVTDACTVQSSITLGWSAKERWDLAWCNFERFRRTLVRTFWMGGWWYVT